MGVEGAEGAGVFVYGVEVCVVFGEHEGAEGFFLGGTGVGRRVSLGVWLECIGRGRGGEGGFTQCLPSHLRRCRSLILSASFWLRRM